MPDLTGCRQLTIADVEPAANIIAQAFMNDPLINFMVPFKSSRFDTLLKFFRVYGEINILNGCGYGVGEPLQGVAYWQSPGQGSISISVNTLGKLLPLLFTWYPVGYFRARVIFKETERLHQKYAAAAHYYLDNLGVLPSAQGKGWSSKLLRPILDQADARQVIAYTDTTTRANVSFYEHFGFQCVEETAVSGTGVTVFALRRHSS